MKGYEYFKKWNDQVLKKIPLTITMRQFVLLNILVIQLPMSNKLFNNYYKHDLYNKLYFSNFTKHYSKCKINHEYILRK